MTQKTLSSMTESELIVAAQAGDRFAFDQLIQIHYTRMVRTALRMVRDAEDAEDVAQQAFTAAWRNLDKYRGDAAFSTWLTRITMNEALSVLRRRRRVFVELKEAVREEDEQGSIVLASEDENPEQRMLRKETASLLRASLERVKPVYRKAMQLRLVDDLSVEEIAGRLRMPVNTVKVHLFRGRQAMKSFLEERMVRGAAA